MNISEIQTQLETLPQAIREQQDKVNLKMKLLDEAELEYDVCFSMTVVGSKAPNATEKKAMSIVGSQTEAEKVIECKYNLEKEKSALKYFENQFIACRKISSIESDMVKSQVGGF